MDASSLTDDELLSVLNGEAPTADSNVANINPSDMSNDELLAALNGEKQQPPQEKGRALGFTERHGTEYAAQTGVDIDDLYGEGSALGDTAKVLTSVAPFAGTAGRAIAGARQKSLDSALESGEAGWLSAIDTDEWDKTEGAKYDLYQRALAGDTDVDYSPIYARKRDAKGRMEVEKDENGNPYLDERYAANKDEARKAYVKELAAEQIGDIARTKGAAQKDLANNTAPWYMDLAHGATSSLGFAAEMYLGGAVAKGVLGTAALASTRLGQAAQLAEKGAKLGFGARTALTAAELTAPTVAHAIERYENLTADDYRMDDAGNVTLAEEGDGVIRGATKAVAGAAFENATEVALGKMVNKVFGATMKGVYRKVPGVKKLFDGAVGKLGESNINRARVAWTRAAQTYAKVQNAVHFELMPVGEFAEEYVQGLGDDVWGLNTRASADTKGIGDFTKDFFDWDAGGKDLFFGVMGQSIALGLGGYAGQRGKRFTDSLDSKVVGALKLQGYTNADLAKMSAATRIALAAQSGDKAAEAVRGMGYDIVELARLGGVKEKEIDAFKDACDKKFGEDKANTYDALNDADKAAIDKQIMDFAAPIYSASYAFREGVDGATELMSHLNKQMQKYIGLAEERQALGNYKANRTSKPGDFTSRVDWTGSTDETGNINWQQDNNGVYIESAPIGDEGVGARIYKRGNKFIAAHPQTGTMHIADSIADAHDWIAAADQFAQKKNKDREVMSEYIKFNANRLVPTQKDKKTGETLGAPVVTANNAKDAANKFDWLNDADRAQLETAAMDGTEGNAITLGDGTVVMFLDNIQSADEALFALSHEIGGHAAIKEGAKEKNLSLEDTIAEVYKGSETKDTKAAQGEYRIRRTEGESKDDARAVAQEEGMVYGNEYRMPTASPLQKAKTAVKLWMKKHGMDAKLTDEDYEAIAAAGLRRIRQTRIGGTDTQTVDASGVEGQHTEEGDNLQHTYEKGKWVSDYYAQREKMEQARAAVDAAEAAQRHAEEAAKEEAKTAKAIADEEARQKFLAEQEQMRKDAEHATKHGREMVKDVLEGWYTPKTQGEKNLVKRIVESANESEIKQLLDALEAEWEGADGELMRVAQKVNAAIKKRHPAQIANQQRFKGKNNPKHQQMKAENAAEDRLLSKYIDEVQMNPNSALAYWLSKGHRLFAYPQYRRVANKGKGNGFRFEFVGADGGSIDALNNLFNGVHGMKKGDERAKLIRLIFGKNAKPGEGDGDVAVDNWIRFKHYGDRSAMQAMIDGDNNVDIVNDEDFNNAGALINQFLDEYAKYEEWKNGDQLTAEEQALKEQIDAENEAIDKENAALEDAREKWGGAIATSADGKPIADPSQVGVGSRVTIGSDENGEYTMEVVGRDGDVVKLADTENPLLEGETFSYRWNKENGRWENVKTETTADEVGQDGDTREDIGDAEPQAADGKPGAVGGKVGGNGAAAEAPSDWFDSEGTLNEKGRAALQQTEMGRAILGNYDANVMDDAEFAVEQLKRNVRNNAEELGLNEAPSADSEGEVADENSFSRRRVDNIVFRKPFVGNTGAKLVAYSWKNKKVDEVDSRGEDRVRKVSDWEEALTNPDTNRDIVHHFTVEDADGKTHIVSAETAAKMLGVNVGTARSEALKQVRREMKLREVTDAQREALSHRTIGNKQTLSITPNGELRIVGRALVDADRWPYMVWTIAKDGKTTTQQLSQKPKAKYFEVNREELLAPNDSALSLESVSAKQIADEEKSRAQKAEIARRQSAPLKGGVGEVGQSLMDLGGAEGEDLFNRTGKWRRSSITPEMDAAYADAVKRGDKETALRMIREAAAKAMPNTKVVDKDGLPMIVWHGTDNYEIVTDNNGNVIVYDKATGYDRISYKTSFNKFDTGKGVEYGAFFSSEKGRAQPYGNATIPFFLNISNPLITNESMGRVPNGFDGAYRENIGMGKEWIAFSPSQIKSADITYDDAGNLIPLSERFNGEKSDIRWRRIGTHGASRSNGLKTGNDLLRAIKIIREGGSRETAWKKTGWWKGRDGKWRLDINDDSFADEIGKYFNLRVKYDGRDSFTIREIIDDENFKSDSLEELVREYPDIADMRIEVKPEHSLQDGIASYSPENDVVYIDRNDENLEGNLVHEFQHAIQFREGFGYGKMDSNLSTMQTSVSRSREMKKYLANLGEMEAFIAQHRYYKGEEYRRKTPPWKDEELYLKWASGKAGTEITDSDIRWRRRYTPNPIAQQLANLRSLRAIEGAFLAKSKNAVGADDMAVLTKMAREIAQQGSVNAEVKDILDAIRDDGNLGFFNRKNKGLEAALARRMKDEVKTKLQDAMLAAKQLEESLGIKKEDSAYHQFDRNYGLEQERMDDLEREVKIPLEKLLRKLDKTFKREIKSKDKNGKDVTHTETAYGLLGMFLMAKHGGQRNRWMAERNPFVQEAMRKGKSRKIIDEVLNGTRDLDEQTLADIGAALGWTNEKVRQLDKGLRGSGATTAFWNQWLVENNAFANDPDAEAARQLVLKMNKMTRDILVSSGRLNAAQAAEWERLSPDYVPLRSDMGVDSTLWAKVLLGGGDGRVEGANGHSYANNEFHHAYGRNDIADDPIAFSVQQYAEAVRRSLDNDARRKFADIVRANPNLGKVFEFVSDADRKDLARRIAIMNNIAKKRPLTAAETDALNKMHRRMIDANLSNALIPRDKVLGANGIYHEVANIAGIERDKSNENDDRTPFIAFKQDGNLHFIRLGGFTQDEINADKNKLSDSDAKKIATQIKKQNLVHAFGADTMRKFTGLFSALRTAYSPYFMLTNLLADRSQGKRNIYATFGKDGVEKYRNYQFNSFGAAKKVLGDKDGKRDFDPTKKIDTYAKEWAENGGRIAGMAVENIRELREALIRDVSRIGRRNIKDLLGDTDITDAKSVLRFLKDVGINGMDCVEYWNSVVEMSTRIAAYATCRDMGYSIADAVSYSRDVTVNFNRKGEWTPTLNGYIAFFNAGIQDIARSFEAFGEGEYLKGSLILGKRGAKMALKLAILGFIFGLIGHWQDNPDDEKEGKRQYKYNKEWEKANKMGIRVGDYTVGIPIRGMARIPYYFGQKVADVVMGPQRIHTAAWDLTKLALGTGYDVMGGAPTPLQAITPSVFKPAAELIENKDFTGRQIYRKDFFGNGVKSEMGRSATSDEAKGFARFVNLATGGDETKSGFIDWQPEIYEKIAEWAGGTAMRDVVQTFGAAKDLVTGRITDRKLRNMPLVNRFIRTVGENSTEFYEKQGEYERKRERFDKLVEHGRMDEAQEMVDENHYLAGRGRGKRYGEELKSIASDIRNLMEEEKSATGEQYDDIHQKRLKSQYQFMRRLTTPPEEDAEGVKDEKAHKRNIGPILKAKKKDEKKGRREEKRNKRGLIPHTPR